MYAFSLACVVGKNLKAPKLIPMDDDAITQGGLEGLGSLVYICWANTDEYSVSAKIREPEQGAQ